MAEGTFEGSIEGIFEGIEVGTLDGAVDGIMVGYEVGGDEVGNAVIDLKISAPTPYAVSRQNELNSNRSPHEESILNSYGQESSEP